MINSANRYKRNVAIGYCVPIVITLLTLTMELSLDKCATGKPRIGEESCFFAGMKDICFWEGIMNYIKVLSKESRLLGDLSWVELCLDVMLPHRPTLLDFHLPKQN